MKLIIIFLAFSFSVFASEKPAPFTTQELKEFQAIGLEKGRGRFHDVMVYSLVKTFEDTSRTVTFENYYMARTIPHTFEVLNSMKGRAAFSDSLIQLGVPFGMAMEMANAFDDEKNVRELAHEARLVHCADEGPLSECAKIQMRNPTLRFDHLFFFYEKMFLELIQE